MKQKKIYIEIMRILAILFVIYIHTSTHGYFLFSIYEPGSTSFWANMFVSVFSKFAARLFFVIAGALILQRAQERFSVLFKKRILKYVIILIIISLVYAIWDSIFTRQSFSIISFFKTLYSNQLKYHLWFMYAYIAFLLLVPVLKPFVQNLKNRYFIYLIIIHLVFQTLPMTDFLIGGIGFSINGNLIPTLPIDIVLLPCLGYYLEHRVNIKIIRNKLWLIWIINIALICLTCLTTYVRGMTVYDGFFSEATSQAFHNSLCFFNCITVYLTIKSIFYNIKMNKTAEKTIILLGSTTFGIYLIHPFILNSPLSDQFIQRLEMTRLPRLLICLIWILCVYLVTLIICGPAKYVYNKLFLIKRESKERLVKP